jgi:predicted SAM-dependent methyltransferase
MVKLNIGCGDLKINGYINVDIRDSVEADIIIDLEKIPYPYDSNSIDEILANDIVEHFSHKDVEEIVKEWRRILKNEGTLIIKTPDFENIINILKRDSTFLRVTAALIGKPEKTWISIPHWLYGAQDYSQNFHKLIFTKIELKKFLEYVGFKVHSITNDKQCETNMVCIATKIIKEQTK